jgi:hypothetical protein
MVLSYKNLALAIQRKKMKKHAFKKREKTWQNTYAIGI